MTDDDVPWVIKLTADTTKEDARLFVESASGQRRPIVAKITERNANVNEIIISIVRDALDEGIMITIEPASEPDEQ
jgi:hypothetical protein